ncbi:MAG: UDP-N-acetylmuramoyl-tripeptide--D-alanyl-D-alanine ligase [Candidatus Liptonbacteria bacterium]|nr:UDP-N-acetylmuramoyl-tripeptide--D-alanyl-D-alanine ligase [Candidatus Liptonbacteria bacterium]
MKKKLVRILTWVLKKLAEFTIVKYRPGVIGITGSVGKTSTKLAIAEVLRSERNIRASSANFNNEIGLPLTILGSWTKISGILFWPKVICVSIWRLIFMSDYPEILILEYGVDRPGDMKYLLSIARPNISVVTAIGEIPVHVEFFSGREEVEREKGRLVECLPSEGFAVLNADDDTVMEMKERTRAHIMTFGFSRGARVKISDFKNLSEGERPIGVGFKLGYGGNIVSVRLSGVFGKVQSYAAAAAASVSLIFGLNLVKIAEALKNYKPAGSRLELVQGVKYTYILDDSYNASPLSMEAALGTLKDLPGKRKVAVLGDMTEIGKYTLEAHERIGRLTAKIVDLLITVGPRAKFIAESATKSGLNKKNIWSFMKAEEAARPVQNLIQKGDLILVKASRAMRLEKIVEEIRAV